MNLPTQCHLWQKERIAEFPSELEAIDEGFYREYPNATGADHNERTLMKCKECGQLYLYEFLEWINEADGNDKMYSNYYLISPNEVDASFTKGTYDLIKEYPRKKF